MYDRRGKGAWALLHIWYEEDFMLCIYQVSFYDQKNYEGLQSCSMSCLSKEVECKRELFKSRPSLSIR